MSDGFAFEALSATETESAALQFISGLFGDMRIVEARSGAKKAGKKGRRQKSMPKTNGKKSERHRKARG